MMILDKNVDTMISRDEEALYIWRVQPRRLRIDFTNPENYKQLLDKGFIGKNVSLTINVSDYDS
jgi:hypothetical protein